MNQRRLNIFERLLLWVLRKVGTVAVGYSVGFDEEIMRQHGITGFFRFSLATHRAFSDLQKQFGDEVAHLLAAFSSFFNGCDYCAWGHLYATNLLYFERTDQLYPVDETEVHALMMRKDSEVLADLEQRLKAVRPEHARLLRRQYEVRTAEGPSNGEEDRLLIRSIALYEWVNECSIIAQAPAPPLNSIARKKDLIARYNARRQPERDARARAAATATVTDRV